MRRPRTTSSLCRRAAIVAASAVLVAGLSVVSVLRPPAASASTPSTTTNTVTFIYTGGLQTWTVPANVLGSISFSVTGGGGGGGSDGGGSNGVGGGGGDPATVTGDLVHASAGDTVTVIVGGGGAGGQILNPTASTVVTGGWGGSGGGGSVTSPDDVGDGAVDFGGGGGGMSAISSTSACGAGSGDNCAIAGGGGGGGGSTGSGDLSTNAGHGGDAGPSSTAGGVAGTIGDCATYDITIPSFGGGGAGGTAGAPSLGASFDTGVVDPGPAGTGGGGGGGAAGGGAGAGGADEDGCVIGGGGGGGGASYIDTTDTTSAVVATAASGGAPYLDGYVGGNGSAGASGEVSFTYTLGVPPTITTPQTSTTFTAGQSYTFKFTTAGTPTPSWGESGPLPSGVRFNDDGDGTATLSGTPIQYGAYPITVTASNGMAPDATETFTLDVDALPGISAPEPSATAVVGQAMIPVDFAATGYPAPSVSTSSTLPPGVTLSASGALSGTPAEGGSFPLTIVASNGVGAPSGTTFILVVSEVPQLTSPDRATFSVGSAASFVIKASAYPTPRLSLSAGSTLPSGVTFVDNGNGTATLTGNPPAGTGGNYPLAIEAKNTAGEASQIFDLVVDSEATFTSLPAIDLDAGSPIDVLVTAEGGYPTPSLTATASALPPGISFTDQGSGIGMLSGTVASTKEGTYTPSFSATNPAGTSTQEATLVVQAPGTLVSDCPTGDVCGSGATPEAPAITSESATTFLEGVPGSFQVVASGTPPPSFAVTSGGVPEGVSLSPRGVLAGTPEVSGTFEFTIQATNGTLPAATQRFTLTVTASPAGGGSEAGGGGGFVPPSPSPAPTSSLSPGPSQLPAVPPAITSAGRTTFYLGTNGSFFVATTGVPAPTLRVVSGSLPSGVKLWPIGLLSGKPIKPGTYRLTIEASNGVGRPASKHFILLVTGAPVLTGQDYRVSGTLTGALNLAISSRVPPRGVSELIKGRTLESLSASFGFSARAGNGSLHLVLSRDSRLVKVHEDARGNVGTVTRRSFYYGGILVLKDPSHKGVLVFRSFSGMKVSGKSASGRASSRIVIVERIRVMEQVDGRKRAIWQTKRLDRPLRFDFSFAPSSS